MLKRILIICWLFPANLLAQNLVPNPGFELFYDCPTGLRQLSKTQKWYSGNTGTLEYFRKDCNFSDTEPHSGKGYIGAILFGGYTDAIEYAGVELTDSLKANHQYCASFHIKAGESFTYIDQIGMLLTPNKIQLDYWAPIEESPQVKSKYAEPIVPELGWIKLSDEIIADGGEKFLLIGNFIEPDKHVKEINEFFDYPGLGWNSYYFIDDVSVIELKDNETCEDLVVAPAVVSDLPSKDTIKLSNTFYFDSDRYELSQNEFDRLIKWKIELRGFEVIFSELEGNTDSSHSDAYNLLLSENRSEYILSILGSALNDSPLVNNNGESKPVSENETEKGKRLNRNVQVKVIGFDKQKR